MNLLCLTMIETKRHGVGSENKLGPFSLHDASKYSLTVPIKIKQAHFLILLVVDWQ
jgi:hypothetical protein